MKRQERDKVLRQLARQLSDEEPVVEGDYFMRCPICRQFFDVRDATEVHYHDDMPHPPMKADA